eukprot:14512951-Alexandrium_andersonii.AAC.1
MALSRRCGPWAYTPPLLRVSGFPDAQEVLAKALSKAVDCTRATQHTFDAHCLARELSSAARRGIDVMLLIDKS